MSWCWLLLMFTSLLPAVSSAVQGQQTTRQNYFSDVSAAKRVPGSIAEGFVEYTIRQFAETSLQLGELKAKLSVVEGLNKQLTEQLYKLKEATHRVVTFHARSSTDPVTFKSGKTLVYDDVHINIGGGYNRTTGHFTAPVSGVYAFFVNCMAHTTFFQEAILLLEGTQLASCLSHRPGADIWDFGGVQVLVHMTAGQKIWIFHAHGNDINARGGFWQMFSGFLLSAA